MIAVTAHAQASDRQKCLEAGMDDHLAKPLEPESLRATLHRWLDPGLRRPPAPSPASKPSPAPVPLYLPGVDLEAGLARCKGKARWLLGLMDEFEASLGQRLRRLAAVAAQEDWKGGALQAHSVRGVALTLSMPEVAEAAEQLEQAFASASAQAVAGALEELQAATSVFQAGWREVGRPAMAALKD